MEMADISGRLEVEDLIQEIVMEVTITFSNVSKSSRVFFLSEMRFHGMQCAKFLTLLCSLWKYLCG
jgi:hypothetical protein